MKKSTILFLSIFGKNGRILPLFVRKKSDFFMGHQSVGFEMVVPGIGLGNWQAFKLHLKMLFVKLAYCVSAFDGCRFLSVASNFCSKIFYGKDIVFRFENLFKQSHEIEPFIRSIFDNAVIEIETINVNISPQI